MASTKSIEIKNLLNFWLQIKSNNVNFLKKVSQKTTYKIEKNLNIDEDLKISLRLAESKYKFCIIDDNCFNVMLKNSRSQILAKFIVQ